MKNNDLDAATEILNKINLLTIKKSVKMICDLKPKVLEDFIQKFPGIIIFFLKILDSKRSLALIKKLTDSSIIYTMEEELRLLLIHEICMQGDDIDKINDMSLFFDLINVTRSDDAMPTNIKRMLNILIEIKKSKNK